METLQFIQSKAIQNICKSYQRWIDEGTKVEVFFGDSILIFMHEDKCTLEVSFEDGYVVITDTDGEIEKNKGVGVQFTIGFKTPKGYISKKDIGVKVANYNDITIDEATELLKFNTDAKQNTFDPYYAQHQAQRRNTIGWNSVISYLQPESGL